MIYSNDEVFEIGKAKIVEQSSEDKVLVIGAGITLDSAMKAHKALAAKGVRNLLLFNFILQSRTSFLVFI